MEHILMPLRTVVLTADVQSLIVHHSMKLKTLRHHQQQSLTHQQQHLKIMCHRIAIGLITFMSAVCYFGTHTEIDLRVLQVEHQDVNFGHL